MILLVNDDGIMAPGLRALYAALRAADLGPILVVAPALERSAQSQAITLDRPLRIEARHEADFFGFAVDGTPTDCVKLALDGLCPLPPTVVVSGINDGPNVGRSIFYSGTVGAAMEAAVMGHCAVAVSRAKHSGQPTDSGLVDPGWAEAAAAAVVWVARLVRKPLPQRVVNLNFPWRAKSLWKPWAVIGHGHAGFHETYRAARDAHGRPGWLIHGEWRARPDATDDAAALANGHPVATLLRPDFNDDHAILESFLA